MCNGNGPLPLEIVPHIVLCRWHVINRPLLLDNFYLLLLRHVLLALKDERIVGIRAPGCRLTTISVRTTDGCLVEALYTERHSIAEREWCDKVDTRPGWIWHDPGLRRQW
jgi:hypothetical protein